MSQSGRSGQKYGLLLGLVLLGAAAASPTYMPGQITGVNMDGLLHVKVAGIELWAVLDGYALTPKAFAELRAFVPSGALLQINVVRTEPVPTIRARFKGQDFAAQLVQRGLARKTP